MKMYHAAALAVNSAAAAATAEVDATVPQRSSAAVAVCAAVVDVVADYSVSADVAVMYGADAEVGVGQPAPDAAGLVVVTAELCQAAM